MVHVLMDLNDGSTSSEAIEFTDRLRAFPAEAASSDRASADTVAPHNQAQETT